MLLKRLPLFLLLIALTVVGVVACNRQVSQAGLAGAEVVHIGIPAPLSGGSAEYGDFMRKGAEIAADEINSQAGPKGVHVDLIFEDSQGTPAEALKAANKLISRDEVSVITDAFNSSATLAVEPIAEREKVPMVVGLSTADAITQQNNPYVMRVCAPNTQLVQTLSKYLLKNDKPSNIAYVYEKTDFGTNLATVMRAAMEMGGVKTVGFEGINPHQGDFASLVTKIKAAKPDMIFLAILSDSALPFLSQAHEAGLQTKWSNAVSLSNPKFLEDAGPLAEGFVGITHFEASTDLPAGKAFVAQYRLRYGTIPTHYSAVYFDTVCLIADAARRGGTNRVGLLQALKSTTDFQGVTGKIAFDSTGQARIGTVVFAWQNGKRLVLERISGH